MWNRLSRWWRFKVLGREPREVWTPGTGIEGKGFDHRDFKVEIAPKPCDCEQCAGVRRLRAARSR